MKVKFTVTKGKKPLQNGILVYKYFGNDKPGPLSPDTLDEDGFASTNWQSDWNKKTVEVHCHTDGVNSGKPLFLGNVTIGDGKSYQFTI